MPCPLCGDIECRCSSGLYSAATSQAEPETPSTALNLGSLNPCSLNLDPLNLDPAAEAPALEPAPEDSPSWREEVAARLNHYQARRKPRPPRYPSLQLRFEEGANDSSDDSSAFLPRATTASNQALALDEFSAAIFSPASL